MTCCQDKSEQSVEWEIFSGKGRMPRKGTLRQHHIGNDPKSEEMIQLMILPDEQICQIHRVLKPFWLIQLKWLLHRNCAHGSW
uniref:Uncharacterized protein n=1 Tax=Anguilla anguilla TaxID=7936 RepID=A0A0E9WLT4_ANGAN